MQLLSIFVIVIYYAYVFMLEYVIYY